MIRRWVDIRPDEFRNSAAGFVTLFGIMAAHALAETSRDALFLARLPAAQLPWVYLGIAVFTLLAVKMRQGMLSRFDGRRCLAFLIAHAAIVTAVLWFLARSGHTALLYVLYAWPAIFATLVITSFWTFLGSLFTIAQAKRLYAMIGAGSILGAIAGSALARLLADRLEPRHLLLAAALLLAASALGPLMHRPPARRDPVDGLRAPGTSLFDDFRLIRARPYVRRILMLMLVTAVTATFVDFAFKSVIAETVPAAWLARIFATYYLALNLVSLLVQLFLVGWLVRIAGVTQAALLLPAMILVGFGWHLAAGGALAIVATRCFDGGLRHSLNRTTTELLFVPLPDDLRARVKGIADVLGQRGGQALAAVLLILLLSRGGGLRELAAVAGLSALVWTVMTVRLRRHYLNLIRHTLDREGNPRSPLVRELDLATLETLVATLSSRDESRVLAALDILESSGRTALIPALILYHPSAPILERSLALFTRHPREETLPILEGLVRHHEASIRAAAIGALASLGADPAILRRALEDASTCVRASALAGLIWSGEMDLGEGAMAVDELLADDEPQVSLCLATTIAALPSPAFKQMLTGLACHHDRTVQAAAAAAMERQPDLDFLPALLPLLLHHDTRDVARAALVAIGPPALQELNGILADRNRPYELRLHMPRTIGRFPAEQAVPLLVGHISEDLDTGILFKTIRALGRIRSRNPGLVIGDEVLLRLVAGVVDHLYRYFDWRARMDEALLRDPSLKTPTRELLTTYLEDGEKNVREWLTRILGLLYSADDFHMIHRGLVSDDRDAFAGSLELVSEILPLNLRRPILGLIDDLPPRERLDFAPAGFRAGAGGYQGLLAEMLEARDLHMNCLVAYHVGELGLTGFRDRLERLSERNSRTLDEVAARALELLDDPRIERVRF